MAYATLLSLTESLELILNPPHHDQSPVLYQSRRPFLQSLHEKLSFLLSFMEEDFAHTKSETMTRLETKIRAIAYKAIHKIESQVSDGLRLKSKDLKKIMEQVNSISAEAEKIKDFNVIKNHPPTKFSPAGSSKSDHVEKTPIVGFRDELRAIKERLFTPPPELAIISIVGMGGIGKTTLARAIFDDSKVVSRFDARGWLTVSQKYDVQDMLARLLKSIQRNALNQDKVRELGEKLYKILIKKRYLVVIDDLWDIKAWDEVKRFFPRDNVGSRIILTTRLLDVAVDANSSSPIYHPTLLNLDESWKLLRQKVFGEQNCPHQLEKVGKEIAKNCKGLPLALAVIGGLLSRGQRKVDYWTHIQQNINSALVDGDDNFMEILALSYYNLPHQLRACFLYMGVFPEDYMVRRSKLIALWIAEGFVKPHTSKSFEEVAQEYLEDLIHRNMILVREWNTIGRIKSCGIHDLMRDLCMRITQEEKFLRIVHKQVQKLPRQRLEDGYHVSIPSDNPYYGSQSRSFLCFDGTMKTDPLLSFILSFQQPRVLDALGVNIIELPFDIANLRFLAWSKWEEFNLNASISKLLHLQTLIIDSPDPITLPVEIWNMPRLRHIWFMKEDGFFSYPSGAKNGENFLLSKNLQTLKGVIDSSSTKDVLQLMSNLKKLKIIFYDVASIESSSYISEYFVHLHQLEYLYCKFNCPLRNTLGKDFHLPSSLGRLTLKGRCLTTKTTEIIGLLPNLQVLNLRKCHFVKKVWEPTEGGFDQLKSLELDRINLKNLKADEMSFPSLEYLRISLCFKLKEIPSSIGDIPTLRIIRVSYNGDSVEKSAALIRKEQEDMGNENLKIIIDEELDSDTDDEDTDDEESDEDTDDDDDDDDDYDYDDEVLDSDSDSDDESEEEDTRRRQMIMKTIAMKKMKIEDERDNEDDVEKKNDNGEDEDNWGE